MKNRAGFFATGLGVILCAPIAKSAELDVRGKLELDGRYDRNPKLLSIGAQPDSIYALNANGSAGYSGETWNAELSPSMRALKFDHEGAYNVNDYTLGGNLTRQFYRGTVSAHAVHEEDSMLAYEWAEDGWSRERKGRVSETIDSQGTYQFNEKISWDGTLSLTRVGYLDAALTTLAGYSYLSTRSDFDFQLNDTWQIGWGFYLSRLDSPRIDNRSNDGGIQLLMLGRPFSILDIDAKVGGHRTRNWAGDIVDTGNGLTAEVKATLFPDTGRVNVPVFSGLLRRSMEPSAHGGLLQRDEATLRVNLRIHPLIYGGFSVRALRDFSENSQLTASNRVYGKVEARMTIDMTANWILGMGASYARQHYTSDPIVARGAGIDLSLSYNFQSKPRRTGPSGASTDGVL